MSLPSIKESSRAGGLARARLRRPSGHGSSPFRGERARPRNEGAPPLGGASGEREGKADWKRLPADNRQPIIAHLDMDAFFAAVEERDNPQFAGMPIVVGADPRGGLGRGVVSTANYAARRYGIFSATPITRAWRFAQEAKARGEAETIFLSGHWSKYSATSHRIMAIIEQLVPHTQPISVDEAYLDLSFTQSFAAAKNLCEKIKQEIKTKEKLTASIGVGPNKLIAKIASDFDKPDGLFVIPPEQVEAFLDPLPLRTIPGIGPKTEAALLRYNVRTIKELKQYSAFQIDNMLSGRRPVMSHVKWRDHHVVLRHEANFTGQSRGESLLRKAYGRGSSTFHEPEPAKSISEQHTFFSDTLDAHILIPQLLEIAPRLLAQLTEDGFTSFRTVTVTVRFADFETHTYSRTLILNPLHPPYQGEIRLRKLQQQAIRLLLPFLDHRKNPQGKFIRLIALRIEKLA